MSPDNVQAPAAATSATKPWPSFKYEPVRGLSDRRISRFLRTQRKNMRRFFAERGLFDELEQMERIRKSRQGMMAKNRMFQEVLDGYATRVSPKPNVSGAESRAAPEPTAPQAAPVAGDGSVDVRPETLSDGASDSGGRDADVGVSEVASADSDGPVIEE